MSSVEMLNVVATGVVGDQTGTHAEEGLPDEVLVLLSSSTFFLDELVDFTEAVELGELFRFCVVADFLKLEAVSSWRKWNWSV